MPHKKRGHGHHKHTKEEKEKGQGSHLEDSHGYRPSPFYSLAMSPYGKSQASQATPKPAAQVSTTRTAQSEKASSGAAMATKPGVVTASTGSGAAAGGSVSVGTAGKVTPKGSTETNTTPPGATVIDMSSAGGTVVDMTPAGLRHCPKEMSKAAPASQAKAPATAPPAAAAAGTAPSTAVSAPAKSAAAVTSPKAVASKADPAKPSKPTAEGAAAAGNVSVQGKTDATKPTQTKVQMEAPPAAAKGTQKAPAVDPFDALASSLPSVDPIAPQQPAYTGPEVKELNITTEKREKCGERDDTLPPGYRFGDMPEVPADVKPKDTPKPMSTDQALDSLSAGFMTCTVPAASTKQEKKGHIDSVSASSAAPANFVPPPGKLQASAAAPPVAKGPTPPADKKAKMEAASGGFSLQAGLPPSPSAKAGAGCPPADKKAKMEEVSGSKPKSAEGGSMNLDALSSLGDLLPTDAPKPELPEVRPEDIVSEDKHKKEKGVFVGEDENTIPPEYRFNKEELEKLPAPKPEPTISTGDALDFLSGDLSTCSKAPAAASSVPPAQQKLPAGPPAKIPGDFSLESALSASTAKKVESGVVPPVAVCPAPPAGQGKVDKPKTSVSGPMSLDALSALSDTLPADAPKPKLPEVRPEDMVSEDKHKKEKGVLVGEDENTIPPEYRFNKEELEKLPAPKPEPTISTGDALDFLSGDLSTCSKAAVQAPVVSCSVPPAQTKVEDLSALDVLSGDLVSSTKAAGVQAPLPPKKTPEKTVCPLPQPAKVDVVKTEQSGTMPLDALSALCDTLPAEAPKPELPKLRPEDIVSEDKHKKEKGVLVGEDENTIPPEYRFKEEELKKLPAPKPEPTMGTSQALDILSDGFLSCSTAPAVQAPVVTPSAPPAQPSADLALQALAGDFVSSSSAATVKSACGPVETTPSLEPGADSALDALSDTLKDIAPTPKQPEPVPTKDIVKEKTIVEERLIKMGERDDTLPPDYRPTEEDMKKMAEAKEKAAAEPKKKTIDDKTALELLSSDFESAPAPVPCSAATTKLEPPKLDSQPLKPMAGAVLDTLADTLIPDAMEAKSQTDKPKKQSEEPSATDLLSAQLSSDVVPTSTTKGGKS